VEHFTGFLPILYPQSVIKRKEKKAERHNDPFRRRRPLFTNHA